MIHGKNKETFKRKLHKFESSISKKTIRSFWILTLTGFGLICLLEASQFSAQAQARLVKLAWNAVTKDTKGNIINEPIFYKVHMGINSNQYSFVSNASLTTMVNGEVVHSRDVSLDGFTADQTVYFCVSAYTVNASDNSTKSESGCSNEVFQTGKVKLPKPGKPEVIGGIDDIQLAQTPFEEVLILGTQEQISHWPRDSEGTPQIPTSIINFIIERHPELKKEDLATLVEWNSPLFSQGSQNQQNL